MNDLVIGVAGLNAGVTQERLDQVVIRPQVVTM
jgi:hypothetical protein